MKKTLFTMLMVVFAVSILSVAVAFAEEVKNVKGSLTSIATAKDSVTFRADGANEDITISVKPSDVNSMGKDEKVVITYDKGKTNVLKKIRKAPKIPTGC